MTSKYETLRLWGPIQALDKYSHPSAFQSLTIAGQEYSIPPNTNVAVNFQALHTNPKYWGEDSLIWRPQRWVDVNPRTGRETLKDAPENTIYVAWSAGPRGCPGKKFSQVEFVAVIAYLLHNFHVEPVVRGNESRMEAAARLKGVVDDSYFFLAPKMARGGDAGIRLVKR
jgi:cytochrome P450